MRYLLIILSPVFLIMLSCCQFSQNNISQKEACIQKAETIGFIKKEIQTNPFLLTTLQRINDLQSPVTIYIEGDGRSWISKNQVSPNPTPLNPLALKLALLDNSANVVYLARPCQYTDLNNDETCHPIVWTDERFSEKVINAMNEALDSIKQKAKANKIHLVGFSGGGGLAVLLAAHRKTNDIASIRTIAGDLDTEAMTAYHNTTPFICSLNPKNYAKNVLKIPQVHYVGEKDCIVPPSIATGYLSQLIEKKNVNLKLIKNTDHHDWEKHWPTLLEEYKSRT